MSSVLVTSSPCRELSFAYSLRAARNREAPPPLVHVHLTKVALFFRSFVTNGSSFPSVNTLPLAVKLRGVGCNLASICGPLRFCDKQSRKVPQVIFGVIRSF